MNKKILSALMVSLFAAASFSASAMTKMEYNSAKDQIKADYKIAKIKCNSLSGNSKDICVAEAKGNEKVGKADLQARYTGKDKDQYSLRVAKAEAAYSVAAEKCDDLTGNAKSVCVKEAKATQAKAKSDAKIKKTVKEATSDSIDDRVTADYKVAVQKCDALSGDAKSVCLTNAKAAFKKS